MTDFKTDRFAGILGDDYQLLKFAYPHHDEFQNAVAEQINQYVERHHLETPAVLEGGCGSGVSSLHILAKVASVKLIGVDNEPKMLDQARVILRDYLERVELVTDDLLQELQARQPGSIDVFVAVWTLHNLTPSYRASLFREVARVLRANSLFISGDKYAVDDEEKHKQMLHKQLDRFRAFADVGNASLAEAWVKHNTDDDKIKIKESEQHSILESLGFSDVKTVYRKDMEAVIIGTKSV